MMAGRARGRFVAACTFVVSALLLGVGGVSAQASPDPSTPPTPAPTQSSTYSRVHSAFALTISPTRIAVGPSDEAKPQTVLVVNRGEDPLHVTVDKQSFTGATNGSLSFAARAPYSAADWVTVSPSEFELAPGASENVTVTVLVPPNPDLGDHQLALVFLVPAGKSSSNIHINRGIAVPVYITVPGLVNDTVNVSGLTAPAFSGGGPVSVSALVQDTGTVHRDFRGSTALAIQGTGSTTFPDFTVVRGSSRNITQTWSPPFICICQLSVAITNAHGVSTSNTVRVIVFPVLPASVAVAIVLVLGILIGLNRRRLRRRAARIAAGRHSLSSRGDV